MTSVLDRVSGLSLAVGPAIFKAPLSNGLPGAFLDLLFDPADDYSQLCGRSLGDKTQSSFEPSLEDATQEFSRSPLRSVEPGRSGQSVGMPLRSKGVRRGSTDLRNHDRRAGESELNFFGSPPASLSRKSHIEEFAEVRPPAKASAAAMISRPGSIMRSYSQETSSRHELPRLVSSRTGESVGGSQSFAGTSSLPRSRANDREEVLGRGHSSEPTRRIGTNQVTPARAIHPIAVSLNAPVRLARSLAEIGQIKSSSPKRSHDGDLMSKAEQPGTTVSPLPGVLFDSHQPYRDPVQDDPGLRISDSGRAGGESLSRPSDFVRQTEPAQASLADQDAIFEELEQRLKLEYLRIYGTSGGL